MTRAGQDHDIWPVALLLFAVLLPVVCLLWFMTAAMRNERLAARQKLADVYHGQLASAQARLQRRWRETPQELENLARSLPGPAAFARCLGAGAVDSVVILDEQRNILYPNTSTRFAGPVSQLDPKWTEAAEAEYLRKDFRAASIAYEALARETTNINLSARALQAQARCLVQAGQTDAAIRLVNDILGGERFQQAADPQGRLIAANAQLMVLELITNRVSTTFQATAQKLKERLLDYENPVLAAPQRRFLMKALQKLQPALDLPTLDAEELAGAFCENPTALASEATLQRTPIPDVWQFMTSDGRVLALVRSERLFARMKAFAALDNLPAGAEVAILPPGVDNAASLVSLAAGSQWPGWRLALSVNDPEGFDAGMKHRTAIYLWTGVWVVATMGVLTLLAVRVVRRQTAVSRLKNDLAAAVSHELKTPLAGMRVLVDTLLDAKTLNEQTTREYLQLIAQENERLSRLIQNFLAFSRMERKKHTFQFTPLAARRVIETALPAMRDRLQAPGCRFEVEVAGDLPDLIGDLDALATALINLLDNACKYTEEIKHISLRARAQDGAVIISIQDNGIGIAPRDLKKIFRPFHQGDQRLSRRGSGCGLGLSIVQFIITAHRGSVSVDSQPGRGSMFTIVLPAALANTSTAAIA